MAIINIISGEATELRVEEEIKHLIDGKWEWKVKQTPSQDYLVSFPNKSILETFSKSNAIELAVHGIKAKVSKSDLSPGVSAVLQTSWIKLYNIPDLARSAGPVKLIAELAGEVVVVDELSLIREGPVRVKLNGRNINKLRGLVTVFINKVGYEIQFLPEDSGSKTQTPNVPPPKKLDEDSDEEEDENSKDTELEWEKMQRQFEEESRNKTERA